MCRRHSLQATSCTKSSGPGQTTTSEALSSSTPSQKPIAPPIKVQLKLCSCPTTNLPSNPPSHKDHPPHMAALCPG